MDPRCLLFGASIKSLIVAFNEAQQFPPLFVRQGQNQGCAMSAIKSFWRDESGATAIEYGLIAAGISIVILTAVKGIGGKLVTTFTSVQNALN